MDGLVDHLLEKVALRGVQGATRPNIDADVHEYYAALAANATPGEPPFNVDEKLRLQAWTWLCIHPDILKKQRPTQRRLDLLSVSHSPDASQAVESTPATASGFATPFVEERQNGEAVENTEAGEATEAVLFAREERMWLTLTGHGRDLKKVPAMSFQLLSMIGSAGSSGILQPDLVHITGQDKRSVPKRTDFLDQLGYIEKRTVQGKGVRTSLCTLKKLIKPLDSQYVLGSIFQGDVVHTHRVLEAIMPALKMAQVMPLDDLREKMGIRAGAHEGRILFKYLGRMESLGLLRRVTARVEDEQGNDLRQVTKCIQFVRDATPADHETFVSFTGPISKGSSTTQKKKEQSEQSDADEDMDEVQASESSAIAKMRQEIEDRDKNLRPSSSERPETLPIQAIWTSDRSVLDIIFDIIDRAGPQGISAANVSDAFPGNSFRHSITEMLANMSEIWYHSQPDHLQHLAVVRDVHCKGNDWHYLYRTYPNFARAVADGTATWDSVLPTQTRRDALRTADWPSSQSLDQWGFPSVSPNALLLDGSATPNQTVQMFKAIAPSSEASRQHTRVETPAGTPRKRGRPRKQQNLPLARNALDSDTGSAQLFQIASEATPSQSDAAAVELSAENSRVTQSIASSRLMDGQQTIAGASAAGDTTADVAENDNGGVASRLSRNKSIKDPIYTPEPFVKLPVKNKAGQKAAVQEKGLPPRPVAVFRDQARKLAEIQAHKEFFPAPPPQASIAESHIELPRGESSPAEVVVSGLQEQPGKGQSSATDGASTSPGKRPAEGDILSLAPSLRRQKVQTDTVVEVPASQRMISNKRSAESDMDAPGRATKRRRTDTNGAPTDTELPPGFSKRVGQLEREYLNMKRSGVYLNPPQCILWKKGRQRSCALTVFKLERLKELSWFSGSTTDRNLYLPRGCTRTVNSESRRSAKEAEPPRPETEEATPTYTGVRQEIGDVAAHPTSPDTVSGSVVEPTPEKAPQLPAFSNRGDSALFARPPADHPRVLIEPASPVPNAKPKGRPRKLPRGMPPNFYDFADAENPSENFAWLRIAQPQYLRTGRRLPGFTKFETRHSRKRKVSKIKNKRRGRKATARQRLHSEQVKSSELPLTQSPTRSATTAPGKRSRRPRTSSQRALDASALEDDVSVDEKEEDNYVPEQESETRLASSANKASTKKNNIVRTGTKSTGPSRDDLILDIIKKNGGAFPNVQKSLFVTFVSMWEGDRSLIPEEKTFNDFTATMVRKGTIRKMYTNFQRDSNVIKCPILCLPEVYGNSPEFLSAIQHARDSFPDPYILPGVEAVELPAPGTYRKNNAFQLDETIVVKRPGSSAHETRSDRPGRRSRLQQDDDEFLPSTRDQSGHQKVSKRHERIQQQKERLAARRTKQQANRKANIAAAKAPRDQPQQTDGFNIVTAEDIGRKYGHNEQSLFVDSSEIQDHVLHSAPTDATAWIIQLKDREKLVASSGGRLHFRRTLTDPGQQLHHSSGTFSTEFAVQKSLRPRLQVDCALQRGFEDRIANALEEIVAEDSKHSLISDNDSRFFSVKEVQRWEEKHTADLTSKMTFGQPLWINHSVESLGNNKPPLKTSGVAQTVRWADENEPSAHVEHISSSSEDSDDLMLDADDAVFEVPKRRESKSTRTSRARKAVSREQDSPNLKQPIRKMRVPVPKPAGRLRGPNTSALLSDEQIKDLMLAVVITRILTGGLDKTIDWNIVDLLLDGKFDLSLLQYRWRHMFHVNRAQIDRMEADFQINFLAAYEAGTVPPIDFGDLDHYDWLNLMKWGQEMLRATSKKPGVSAAHLPATRAALEARYNVQVAPKAAAKHADMLKTTSIMDKEGIMDDLNTAAPVKFFELGASRKKAPVPLEAIPVLGDSSSINHSVAKTYIRASVIADEKTYNARAARSVLEIVPEECLAEAKKTLSNKKMLKQPPKARLIPGRNFKIHNDFKKPFNTRKDFNVFFYPAYHFKRILDEAIANSGSATFNWKAYEGETAAILNLIASRQIEPHVELPPINHNDERQFVEDGSRLLSVWGFTECNYETSKVPRERLNWNVVLRPTAAYRDGNPLPNPLPPVPAPHQDENGNFVPGRAIPVWYDIHNNFLRWVWLPLLNVIMWDLTIGAGKTASDIAMQFNSHIESWEIETVLVWLEKLGLASHFDGGQARGWVAEHDWWMLIGHMGKDIMPTKDADEDLFMAKLDK